MCLSRVLAHILEKLALMRLNIVPSGRSVRDAIREALKKLVTKCLRSINRAPRRRVPALVYFLLIELRLSMLSCAGNVCCLCELWIRRAFHERKYTKVKDKRSGQAVNRRSSAMSSFHALSISCQKIVACGSSGGGNA